MNLFMQPPRLKLRAIQTHLITLIALSGLTLILMILSAQPVRAAAITVNSLADNETSVNGLCTLREAISNANSNSDGTGGDCVSGSGADVISFNLSGTITIMGESLPSITSAITIDGSGQTVAISGNDAFLVFEVAVGGDLTLNTLTIQNGNAGEYYGDRGGAVYNTDGALTVNNVTFTGNFADQGGAIYTDYESDGATVTNSTFTGNSANEGSALYAFASTITVTNSTFTGNTATGSGGAVFVWGTVNITSSSLTGNSAVYSGGSIYNYGTLTVTNSTISNNDADSGAGIFNYSSSITVTNSILSNNIATTDGGGIFTSYGTNILTSNTISGNQAGTSGGGIYAIGATLIATSNTISGNSAVNGGGLYRGDSISGGISLAGNLLDTGSSGANCGGLVYHTDNGYNMSDDASCKFYMDVGSRNNAPLNLNPLTFNEGGSTLTHAPAAGSAAMATIPYGTTVNNNGVTLACNASSVDQNGISHPRIPNGACSSGSVEAVEGVILCPNPASITSAADLNACLTWSNAYPGADNLTVGANITLAAELPYIIGNVTLHGGGYTVDGNHAVRIFRVAASGSVSLDGFTIQNGSSGDGGGISNAGTLTVSNSTITGNTTTGNGGGINSQGTLTITNTSISNNSAAPPYSFGGGGIYNFGPLTITGSTISGNTTGQSGGGIYNHFDTYYSTGGPLTITSTTISGNTATGSLSEGGGVYTGGGTASLTSVNFSNNTAVKNGGGLYADYSGAVTVTGGSFTNNTATGTNSNGGGIYADLGAPLTVTNTILTNNSAGYGGGLIAFDTTIVKNSTFSSNTAVSSGGGLYNRSTMNVLNTTLSTNSATYGGAVFSEGQTVITQATISGNNGSYDAGGIYSYFGGVYLAGVLLDSGSEGGNCIINTTYGGQIFDNRYNLSDDAACGFNQPGSANNIALLLGPLQDNGGPTLTRLPAEGSPAIDRIANGATVNNNGTAYVCNQNGQPLDTDQRGEPRPSPAAGGCDAGAVEVSSNFDARKPVLVSPANGSSVTTNPPRLTWNAVSGAVSYRVLMDTTNPPTTALTTLSSTGYTLPGLLNIGTTYYWRVVAINASSEESMPSDVFSFTIASTASAAPVRNVYTTDRPILTWNPVSWSSGYHIQVSADRYLASQMYADDPSLGGDDLTFQTAHLPNGLYYWRVKARQPNGTWGAWSVIDSFMVNAP